MDVNQLTYEQLVQVRAYARHTDLFPAEKQFIEQWKSQLASAHLLDIGIGAGRTTAHFANRVEKYVGIDYSEAMIQWCRKRFATQQSVDLHVMDARRLLLANESFDFVLFSFNGIDCVPYEDRHTILKECGRVLRPSGIFSFSFHNVLSIDFLYSFQLPRNPLKVPAEIHRWLMLRKLNGPARNYHGQQVVCLFDGADNFKTRVCYVHPDRQVAELEQLGFRILSMKDLATGRHLASMHLRKVSWIFVEAQKR